MGVYFNPQPTEMEIDRNSPIYVDKSGLLAFTNAKLNTNGRFVCVSRPRRFGKTMAARMLTAYYSKGRDSASLFNDLAIASHPSYRQHLNKYNVVFINTLMVWEKEHTFDAMKAHIESVLVPQLEGAFPSVRYSDKRYLSTILEDIFRQTGERFVVVIDEWDSLLREDADNQEIANSYLRYLRDLLKDKAYVALAYFTGILPVRKYGSQSALNMFNEYTMVNPGALAEFMGFTDAEVRALCQRFQRNYDDIRRWYDGYSLGEGLHVYSPCSVVKALERGVCDNYWTSTESFESLRRWLELDFDGLRSAVIRLLDGKSQLVDVSSYNNSFCDITNCDAVLVLLVHLGYLAFRRETQEVFVPNLEIGAELSNVLKGTGWDEIARALRLSLQTMQAVWDRDEETVAQAIANAHYETSILDYNNEKALRYTVLLAFYAARRFYNVVQECPTGKGFADMVFLPITRYADKPALVVELKWNQEADSAIKQIKEKHYLKALEGYKGSVLLVGISYDKESKKHECAIEEIKMSDIE